MRLIFTFTEYGHKIRRVVTTLDSEFDLLDAPTLFALSRKMQRVERDVNEFPHSKMSMSIRVEKD